MAFRYWTAVLVAAVAVGSGMSRAADESPRQEAASGQDDPASPEQAHKGKSLFNQMCSHCHGIDMVNPGNASFDLRKFPPNDRPRFFNSVTKGKNNMPAWGDLLKLEEIELLWAYIRTGGKS